MVTRTVDHRADTVTRPTETMRAAMASADVEDNVYVRDPGALLLETELAKITSKEAALFVPSGTMGVHPRTVKNNEDGTMDLDLIEGKIRDPGELVYPTARLICLENSQANCGGRCLSAEYTDKVGELAKKHGLKLHIDGSCIFNASVALGVPVHRLVQAADSVMVCLSKGLGAPVGSVIVVSKSFINKARILRKTLGGCKSQGGILCAAALVAMQENVPKLEDDHKNAKTLAEGLNQIKGLKVNASAVETNIIFIEIDKASKITADTLCKNLEKHGILVKRGWGPYRIRIVLHYRISPGDVQYTLSCFQQAMSGGPAADENGN